MAQRVELQRDRAEGHRRSRYPVLGGVWCIGVDLPQDSVVHALCEAAVALVGRCRQQRLDGPDAGRLDEADRTPLADAEPPGHGDPVDPGLKDALARSRRRRREHPVGIAQEAEQGWVGEAELDLRVPSGAQLLERVDVLR